MINGSKLPVLFATCVYALPFCRTEHQMVTMSTQMMVKTRNASTPPITAYGSALWVSTTAPGSEGTKSTISNWSAERLGRQTDRHWKKRKKWSKLQLRMLIRDKGQRSIFSMREREHEKRKVSVSSIWLPLSLLFSSGCARTWEKGAEMRRGCRKKTL